MRSTCQLCAAQASDTHHIFPVQYGGADSGPKVELCKNHHTGNGTGVHWWADQIWKREATLEAVPRGDYRQLVKAILDQRTAHVRSGVAPDARRRIVAELTAEEQQLVRLVKNHHGFNSIETMLKSLIRREAERIKGGQA